MPISNRPISGSASFNSRVIRWKPRERGDKVRVRCNQSDKSEASEKKNFGDNHLKLVKKIGEFDYHFEWVTESRQFVP
jgi:hypothetical protein